MRTSRLFLPLLLFSVLPLAADEEKRIAELDAYWAEVSRAVREGDFEAYKRSVHPEGVLVTSAGKEKASYPLAKALARWKKEFDATKAGDMEADVVFRFSQRLGDDTTAHESGIFLYTAEGPDGRATRDFINFEALLVKRGGQWVALMEYQESKASEADWKALE